MKKFYLILLYFFIPVNCYAVTDLNRTITSVGAQGAGGYFSIAPAPSTTCLHNVLYIDASSVGGRLLYAVLLTAYSAGVPLTRIDYAVNANGTCNISLLNF